jgi:hypothetical protein
MLAFSSVLSFIYLANCCAILLVLENLLFFLCSCSVAPSYLSISIENESKAVFLLGPQLFDVLYACHGESLFMGLQDGLLEVAVKYAQTELARLFGIPLYEALLQVYMQENLLCLFESWEYQLKYHES